MNSKVMLELLDKWDISFFLFLNDLYSPFWDQVMWWISAKYTWIPLYLFILGWIIVKKKWETLILLLIITLLITLSDQISVRFFKEVIIRLRPCHNPDLAGLVHIVNGKCGGQYGFISSHAANSFAIATFTLLLFKNRTYSYLIVFWALIVSYSRIYLGVHYPGDILGGIILGLILGRIVYDFYERMKHYWLKNKTKFRKT